MTSAPNGTAWLAHDLFFSDRFRCKGGPGGSAECDLGAPCWRHDHLFAIAGRLLRWRELARAAS